MIQKPLEGEEGWFEMERVRAKPGRTGAPSRAWILRPMPEPSDADRRKAAQLDPFFANARLVDALECDWEIGFRCQLR